MKKPMIDVGYDLSSMNYGNEDFDFIINIQQAAGVEYKQLEWINSKVSLSVELGSIYIYRL